MIHYTRFEDIVANRLSVDATEQQISSVVTKINGEYHILNYLISNKMGWKIASVMPVNQYYKNVNMMMIKLGISCFIILLIGLMVSLYFTKITYNPLTNLVNQIITNLETKQLKKGDNECELINSAVTNMSMKIEGLEQILSTNMPMIKNNVIKAILKGITHKEDEIAESLKMINVEMECPYFITAIIDLEQDIFKNLSIGDRQYTRINIMNNIERIKMADLNCYTTEISDFWIGVIINFNHIESQKIKELFKQMDQLPINKVSVIFSQVYEDIINSRLAFSECKVGAKYKKILIDNAIISYEDIVVREKNRSKISREFINELDVALKIRDITKITDIVNQFISLIQKEPYSYKECQFNILSMVSLLSTYSKEMGYNSKLSQKRLFIEEFQEIQSIIEFQKWFLETAQCIFDFIEQRNQNQVSDTINLIKKFICEHISDELSLDLVANTVNLNPKYLSKLFIEETNTSFIDYVTSVRMEKARQMLVESNMSINKISAEVGYLTSSYFIKKFKETYGYTPAKYRKYHTQNS